MAADTNASKKVKPYPIPLKFKATAENIGAKILRVTLSGFIAEVGALTVKTGERLECEFELPVLHAPISEPVVVIKVYTQLDPLTRKTLHYSEMHFTALSDKSRAPIAEFMRMIGDQGTNR